MDSHFSAGCWKKKEKKNPVGGLLRDLENKEPNWQQPTADEEQLGAIELFAVLLLQR
jgi:hypothetical protein